MSQLYSICSSSAQARPQYPIQISKISATRAGTCSISSDPTTANQRPIRPTWRIATPWQCSDSPCWANTCQIPKALQIVLAHMQAASAAGQSKVAAYLSFPVQWLALTRFWRPMLGVHISTKCNYPSERLRIVQAQGQAAASSAAGHSQAASAYSSSPAQLHVLTVFRWPMLGAQFES